MSVFLLAPAKRYSTLKDCELCDEEAGGNDDELGGADEVLPAKQSEAGDDKASLKMQIQHVDCEFYEKTFAPSLPLLGDVVVESR